MKTRSPFYTKLTGGPLRGRHGAIRTDFEALLSDAAAAAVVDVLFTWADALTDCPKSIA